ncbi:SIR2 family protein [Sphingobacterium sp.]|uniref:SIR2 family protein n=1 Tax=Sphingobacterium sp. TaxID=341027 RepID=UPI002FDA8A11
MSKSKLNDNQSKEASDYSIQFYNKLLNSFKINDFYNDSFIEYYDKNNIKFNNSLKDINERIIKHIGKKKLNNEDLMKEIKSIYKNEKLVLVLGAGVSMGYGLPGWDVLLQKLMVNTIEEESEVSTILSKLFSKIFNPSPLIAGRYLQEYFEENDLKFENEVRKILYETFDRDFHSDLIQEILKLCIAPGKSPNLNSIITYNFDDILEETLNASRLDIPFKPIYGNGIGIENGELPIYHVHGYLPRDGSLNDNNNITFGENVYHQQYTNLYSWNNIVQINKFRDHNCLFIGTSLTDPNTRRLLDIAKQQRTQKDGFHYCFKRKHEINSVSKLLEIILNEDKEILNQKNQQKQKFDETVQNLINIVQSFEENDLKSLGIKTIWVDEYTEIPSILSKIRK